MLIASGEKGLGPLEVFELAPRRKARGNAADVNGISEPSGCMIAMPKFLELSWDPSTGGRESIPPNKLRAEVSWGGAAIASPGIL